MTESTIERPSSSDLKATVVVNDAELDRAATARAEDSATLASRAGVWTTTASGRYPETTCAINASAIAFIQNAIDPTSGLLVRALVIQTNSDIHNPYVFVGVTIGVYTDVFDDDDVVATTTYHEAKAGAVLDPAGNNRAYSWVDTKALPDFLLDSIAGIRIRFANGVDRSQFLRSEDRLRGGRRHRPPLARSGTARRDPAIARGRTKIDSGLSSGKPSPDGLSRSTVVR
jgi:multidrug efflux pump subunit AcrA (membrane-fusion protein)